MTLTYVYDFVLRVLENHITYYKNATLPKRLLTHLAFFSDVDFERTSAKLERAVKVDLLCSGCDEQTICRV